MKTKRLYNATVDYGLGMVESRRHIIDRKSEVHDIS